MYDKNRWLGERRTDVLNGLTERVSAELAPARRFVPVALPVGLLVVVLWLAGVLGAAPAVVMLAVIAGGVSLGVIREKSASGLLRPVVAVGSGRGREWRSLVDALPDAALVLDHAGHVLHYNRAATELFPTVKPERALSRSLRNPELMSAIDRAMSASEPVVVQVVERIPVERRIAATVTRLAGTDGRREGRPALLVTFRDLSEQEKLSQMREDFIANASHELRTPLASLKGFLETLQGPARNDEQARDRFLAMMASQAERMSRLIDDLLSLSRVEMQAHVLPRGIVDLNEVASYAIQTMEPQAAAADVDIVLEPHPTPARVRADRDQLVQVILNLLQNAITHGGEKQRIEVRVTRIPSTNARQHRFSVAVKDNGPGIAPEHLPRLPERFYRANVASSRAKGGTGLGLAIVKHIVARHRGDLEISSKVGAGSTFTVIFDELSGT